MMVTPPSRNFEPVMDGPTGGRAPVKSPRRGPPPVSIAIQTGAAQPGNSKHVQARGAGY